MMDSCAKIRHVELGESLTVIAMLSHQLVHFYS